MDEKEENGNPRLGVDDKRHLFMVLMAKVERLFYLNRFPVDQYDFALSLQEPDVEAAWRLLSAKVSSSTLSPKTTITVPMGTLMPWGPDEEMSFMLSIYPDRDGWIYFMDVEYDPMKADNRFLSQVSEWADRQVQLEDQMLRAIKVIKAIVTSCNTVGQYRRVSPELLGFLPSKYGDALKGYTKKSPYPAIEVSKEEIDTAMGTLAYASLQPTHYDESEFIGKTAYRWHTPHYGMNDFPRTDSYQSNDCRSLNL